MTNLPTDPWTLTLESGAPEGANGQPIAITLGVKDGVVSGASYDPYQGDFTLTHD